jgi:predicted GNAT superfamily acetyltransferase
MTAVLSEYRDRGVGRQLKLFQRQDALERRIGLVEWTFDPLEMRNAHFNLMRLGAVVRTYHPNFYGITTSPLHGGMPTDRLVAEWWLRSPRVERIVAGKDPEAGAAEGPDARTILVPAQMGEWKRSDPARAIAEQARIRAEFQQWLAQDYVATAITQSPEGSRYLLQPYQAVKGDIRES